MIRNCGNLDNRFAQLDGIIMCLASALWLIAGVFQLVMKGELLLLKVALLLTLSNLFICAWLSMQRSPALLSAVLLLALNLWVGITLGLA